MKSESEYISCFVRTFLAQYFWLLTIPTYMLKSNGELLILFKIVRNSPVWSNLVLEKEGISQPTMRNLERLQPWNPFYAFMYLKTHNAMFILSCHNFLATLMTNWAQYLMHTSTSTLSGDTDIFWMPSCNSSPTWFYVSCCWNNKALF